MDDIRNTNPEATGETGQNDNRFKRFFRSLLRYLAVTIIVLALASLLVWLVFVRPVATELEQTRSDLQEAQATTSELQSELTRLESIEAQLIQIQGQRDLLRMLAQVNAARFALAENDLNGAQGALAETEAVLNGLSDSLGEEFSEQIDDMLARLALVNEEILDAEKFSAQRDLEVLANLILSMEAQLLAD